MTDLVPAPVLRCPRARVPRTMVRDAGISVYLMWAAASFAGGQSPANLPTSSKIYRTTDTVAAGKLTWEVVEVASGKTLNRGARDLHINEFILVGEGAGTTARITEKRLDLADNYYLKLDPSGSLVPSSDFALAAGRNGEETFSWDWFQVNGVLAKKTQERGELSIGSERIGSLWETTRTLFLTDVSIRVMPAPTLLSAVSRSIKWRVNIRSGSDIHWPVLVGGRVVHPAEATTASLVSSLRQ